MKKKLVFIIPTILFLGFLAFKPPAIGSEKGDVVITPTSTFTPTSKPGLRDFDDEGSEPRHSVYERGHEGLLPEETIMMTMTTMMAIEVTMRNSTTMMAMTTSSTF